MEKNDTTKIFAKIDADYQITDAVSEIDMDRIVKENGDKNWIIIAAGDSMFIFAKKWVASAIEKYSCLNFSTGSSRVEVRERLSIVLGDDKYLEEPSENALIGNGFTDVFIADTSVCEKIVSEFRRVCSEVGAERERMKSSVTVKVVTG